jgi:ADP-ribosyl-[dinitrogen reductase] hydrolase
MSKQNNKNINEYISGCFIGLLVGDAAGASIEFYDGDLTSEIVKNAMKMPGGGVFNIGKGQITDDGELALSLGYALINNKPENGFPKKEVFDEYHKWFNSYPFDIGMTCRNSFCHSVIDEDLFHSQRSEANGALMRIAPLAIWGRNLDYKTLADYAKQDAKLSHPNIICQDINALYCIAISYLLNNPGDNKGCIDTIKNFIIENEINQTVISWFNAALKHDITDAKTNIGHVYYAFYLSIYHLNKGSNYEEAIYGTLMKGGDTDTNAAIVGGIIGALKGLDNIPDYMTYPVLNFDPKKQGRKRPEKYAPNKCLEIMNFL